MAQSFSVERVESVLLAKIESKLSKLRHRQLALAAQITVANSLLLGCIWYLIVIWAGKRTFFTKLQLTIDQFLWAVRSRVARATGSQPKEDGRLGLITVEAHYDALTSNLMIWIMAEGVHPLRMILQEHIKQVVESRWGIADLSWLVSKCGTMQIEGSAPWRNLCQGWTSLKPLQFYAHANQPILKNGGTYHCGGLTSTISMA